MVAGKAVVRESVSGEEGLPHADALGDAFREALEAVVAEDEPPHAARDRVLGDVRELVRLEREHEQRGELPDDARDGLKVAPEEEQHAEVDEAVEAVGQRGERIPAEAQKLQRAQRANLGGERAQAAVAQVETGQARARQRPVADGRRDALRARLVRLPGLDRRRRVRRLGRHRRARGGRERRARESTRGQARRAAKSRGRNARGPRRSRARCDVRGGASAGVRRAQMKYCAESSVRSAPGVTPLTVVISTRR